MLTTRREAKHESVRIKRIVLDLQGVIVDSKRVVLFEYEKPLLSWVKNRERRDPKRGSYLLNTKHDNVQNLADVWKCRRPCHWLLYSLIITRLERCVVLVWKTLALKGSVHVWSISLYVLAVMPISSTKQYLPLTSERKWLLLDHGNDHCFRR